MLPDLREIASAYRFVNVDPFIERHVDDVGNVTFGFYGSPVRFTFSKAAVDYINYRLGTKLTERELVENSWADGATHTWSPIGELNARLEEVYGERAIASFRDNRLISLLGADYVVYTHTEILDAVEAAGLVEEGAEFSYYFTDHKMVIVFDVTSIGGSMIELHLENGTAGTVAFGFSVHLSSNNPMVDWLVPVRWATARRQRHLDFKSKGATFDKIIEDLKQTLESTALEAAIKAAFDKAVFTFASPEFDNFSPDGRELEILAQIFEKHDRLNANQLIEKASELAEYRGYKTAAIRIINAVVKAATP
jgi:hypothetical protein